MKILIDIGHSVHVDKQFKIYLNKYINKMNLF